MAKVLTEDAVQDRLDWRHNYGGCTCFLSPPCSSCVHPGNPQNQDEDPDAWKTVCDREVE